MRRVSLALSALFLPGTAAAQDTPERPAVKFNRWQEDWRPLADPARRTQPLDGVKYLPLGGDSYLSLGGGARLRYEHQEQGFGISAAPDDYLIARIEAHADLRLGQHIQAFVQLLDAEAPGKRQIQGPDANRLDLEQGFVALVLPLGRDTIKARAGRQQFAFDLQRFVSARDGPNVRQSFDALWADYETPRWRFIGYLTQPVVNRDARAFDDGSSRAQTFSGLRVEYKLAGRHELSFYWSRYTQDGARFVDARGDETRDVFDLRFAGQAGRWDWDLEAMAQRGRVGAASVEAWALGLLGGYALALPAAPRIGLQIDVASGDRRAGDGRVETFNPLFPNGYYFTIAGFTGDANLIHVKPSLTLRPVKPLKLLLAGAAQWRLTSADAVYRQPNVAIPGTAGRPGRYTGAYAQLRADWTIAPGLSAALEGVYFAIGRVLRDAGGSDGRYLGIELKYGF